MFLFFVFQVVYLMSRTHSSSPILVALQAAFVAVMLAGVLMASGVRQAQAQVQTRAVVAAQTDPVRGRAPAITITGIVNETVPAQAPSVGHVLKAETGVTDPDQDVILTVSYLWRRGATQVGNEQRYTTTAGDAGQNLIVEVTATTDSATTDPASGSATTTIAVAVNTAPTATPTITGTTSVGSVLTGNVGYSDADGDAEGVHTYQWYRADNAAGTSNRTPISGATAAAYTIASADQGKYLVFEVTPKSATGTPDTGAPASRVTATPVAGRPPIATNLSIGGRATVGSTLTADYTYHDADGDAEGTGTGLGDTSIDWCRGSSCGLVPDFKSRTYVVSAADAGAKLKFIVRPRSLTGNPSAGELYTSPETAVIVAEAAPTATQVSIAGTPAVGTQLTGHYTYADANQDPEGASTFKWYRADNAAGTTNKVVISGATAKTYTPVAADRNKFLVFEVTPVAATGTPSTGTPASAVSAAVPGTAPTVRAGSMGIEGTFEVGQTLTGRYEYEDADGDAEDVAGAQFQWYVGNPVGGAPMAIAGATNRTYVVQPSDQGSNRKIWFNVLKVKSLTGTPNERVQTWSTDRQGLVAGRAPTATPTVTGTTTVGSVLTGTVGYNDADGDAEGTHTYQWYRADNAAGTTNKVVISGATALTYTITSADQGKYLVFEVTPKSITGSPNTGVPTGKATASAVTGTAPTVKAGSMGIEGTFEVGQTLTGRYEYEDADGDAEDVAGAQFQWYVGNPVGGAPMAIAGATNRTYVVQPSDQGSNRKIWFNVLKVKSLTGTPNERVQTWSTDRQGLVAGRAPTANPTIAGTLDVGSVLTGSVGYADADGDAEGTHTYQWYRADDAAGTVNKVVISGATAATYTAAQADAGKYLVFEVTPKSATGAPNTGAPTSKVTASTIVGGSAPTASPTLVIPMLQTGATMTGNVGYADADGDAEGTHLYQWYRADDSSGTANRTPISGATAVTYTTVGADRGKYIVFEVTPKSATGMPNTGVPASVVTPYPVAGSPPTANPGIAGTTTVGQVLTGSVGYADIDGDPPGVHTYRWYRADNAAGTSNKVAIAGATAVTYTIVAADQGKYLVFEVTPKSESAAPNTGVPTSKVTASAIYSAGSSSTLILPHNVNHAITVMGSGNASSNSKISLHLEIWSWNGGTTGSDTIDVWLTAPNGNSFKVGTCWAEYSMSGPRPRTCNMTANLSSAPISGTWHLKFTPAGNNNILSIRLWGDWNIKLEL